MKILAACFTILGFNPYVIIYIPVGNDRIPKGLSGNPDNGKYDIVFRTNRTQLKDKDWKAIRNKLPKTKWTTYKFKYNKERVEKYFEKKAGFLRDVPSSKILKKAGAGTWLAVGTAFFSFPKAYFQREALHMWNWIDEWLKEYDWKQNYHKERDYITCESIYFNYGGYRKKKYTHEKPGCTFNIEIYDINIANRYLREKDYFIKNARMREKENKIEGYNQFTFASTNILKITLGGKKKKEASQDDSP